MGLGQIASEPKKAKKKTSIEMSTWIKLKELFVSNNYFNL